MEKELIKEGSANIYEYLGKVSKELDVFYNPKMVSNRDISVLFTNAINKLDDKKIYDKHMKTIRRVHLPMSASGVRGIRMINECDVYSHFNDISEDACSLIKENLNLNKINENYEISNEDARLYLLKKENKYDYVDIDPYGSPNPFLDSILQRIKYGYLAVTATDTAPLCGAYINMCKRKYWARPIYNHLMHEVGLRILIRKVQLVAAQYFRALIPLVSYYKDHYFRVIFFSIPSKKITDKVLKQHKTFDYNNFEIIDGNKFGPIYTGKLNHKDVIEKMIEEIDENISKDTEKFLNLIQSEHDSLGFYHIHKICQEYKIKSVPSFDKIMNNLSKNTSRTMFSEYGIKTESNLKEILEILKKK